MEGRLLTANCADRVEKAIELAASLVAEKLGSGPSLYDVLEAAEKLVAEASGPCVNVDPASSEYMEFLADQLDSLAKPIFNASMEATARHLERLGFNEYALISVTLIGYALNTMQLVTALKLVLSRLELADLQYLEPLVFAAVLRYLGVCRFVRDTPSRKLRRLAGKLVQAIEEYSREDSTLLAAIRALEWVEPG